MPIVIPTPTNLLEQVEKRVYMACSQVFPSLTPIEINNLIAVGENDNVLIKKLLALTNKDKDTEFVVDPKSTTIFVVDAEGIMPVEQLKSLPDYLFKEFADLNYDFFPIFVAKCTVGEDTP